MHMQSITNKASGFHRRTGETYAITKEEVDRFREEGFIVLEGVLSEEELKEIDPWFELFVAGRVEGMDRDFCDMSQAYGTPIEEFQLVNAMLPSKYRPEFNDNIFQRISKVIADQLYAGGEAGMDYEQFLAKKPSKEGAEFAMHQDLGYWPKTENTWTATFSLALSDSGLENGCLQVVPKSNKEEELRSHRPKDIESIPESGDELSRDDSHTLVIDMKTTDEVVFLPVKRGSITIHDERIVHGSGGNSSDQWRKTYIIAYRDVETISEEREMGFTHSHNDKVDWNEII